MPRVFLTRCESYEPRAVRAGVEAAFDAFDAARHLRPGTRVLVKPNMLSAMPPERAVTTHPAVVEAVLRLLADCGAAVCVGDSPGIGSCRRVAERAGIAEVVERFGAKLIEFDQSVEVATPGDSLFRRIEVARAAVEAEAIINLPKFKTHGQMVLTMAVKNLFGCVVGPRKAQWHVAAGRDREAFARLLLELARLLAPRLNLVDGVTGMDGNGPSAGRVRPVNVLLAGEDALAVDRVAARLAGLAEDSFPLVCAARKSASFAPSLGPVEIIGAPAEGIELKDFVLPANVDAQFGPRVLRRFLKRAVAARPRVNRRACRQCGVCVKHCPPEAMRLAKGRVQIDHALCISCFCCQEMCPQQAISIRRGMLARLVIRRSAP